MARFAFLQDFPDCKAGWYAHYRYLPPPSSDWLECDVRGVVREHQQAWLDDFDAWHAELCREGESASSWWWTSPASRPNLWAQSDSIKPLFFAAALREWSLRHPQIDLVQVVGAPQAVRTYVEEFEQGASPRAPKPWRAFARGLWNFAAQLSKLPAYAFNRAPVGRQTILFYSHLFFPMHGVGDHFFGAILDRTSLATGGDIQVAYYIDGVTKVAEVRGGLRKRPLPAWLVLDCLSLLDVVRVSLSAARLWTTLPALGARVPAVRLGACESRSFPLVYLAEQAWARPPVTEMAIHHALARALDRSNAGVVVYPYEEKGLERGLLRACRERTVPVRAVGYAHPAHTKAHLALRSRTPPQSGPPAPDLIMTPGPFERSLFVDWGRKPADRVVAPGSHRYRAPGPPFRPAVTRGGDLRILMITGHGFELASLANLVARRPDVFASDEVRIRRTTGGWFKEQDDAIVRLTALSDRITVEAGSLAEQVEWCDVVLFSSTTAGIEAMLAGRLAVYVALHDLFEADPLVGQSGAFARCEEADELADALASARALDDREHERILGAQTTFASRILSPIDQQAFIEAINGPTHAAADNAPAAGRPALAARA